VSHAKALADRGVLRHRVAPGEDGAMRVVDRGPVRGSQDAVTGYEIVRRVGDRALVKLTPETGRTHQIRVHLAHIGHPIMGDATYAAGFKTKAGHLSPPAREALDGLGRQALHAARLSFTHPKTGERVEFRSELPADIARLRLALAS
jgi:23S rRNA pseudouridine1911/1915/1917 synthase